MNTDFFMNLRNDEEGVSGDYILESVADCPDYTEYSLSGTPNGALNGKLLRVVRGAACSMQALEKLRFNKNIYMYDDFRTSQFSGEVTTLMRYQRSRRLSSALSEGAVFTKYEVISFLRDASAALIAAHSEGLMHGSLTPSSVYLSVKPDELLFMLGDFETALLPSSTERLLSALPYMSPERRGNAEASEADDIYSVGMIAYRILFGSLPFAKTDKFSEMLNSLTLNEPPIFPQDADKEVAELISRCIYGDRFKSAAELADAVSDYNSSLIDSVISGSALAELNEPTPTEQEKPEASVEYEAPQLLDIDESIAPPELPSISAVTELEDIDESIAPPELPGLSTNINLEDIDENIAPPELPNDTDSELIDMKPESSGMTELQRVIAEAQELEQLPDESDGMTELERVIAEAELAAQETAQSELRELIEQAEAQALSAPTCPIAGVDEMRAILAEAEAEQTKPTSDSVLFAFNEFSELRQSLSGEDIEDEVNTPLELPHADVAQPKHIQPVAELTPFDYRSTVSPDIQASIPELRVIPQTHARNTAVAPMRKAPKITKEIPFTCAEAVKLRRKKAIDIPYGYTIIADNAFTGFDKLEIINIPDSIVKIGSSAFEGCTSLSKINLPVGLEQIGNSAFRNCTSLPSVIDLHSISVIGKYAFSGCSSLTRVTLSEDLIVLDESAFESCHKLAAVTIKGDLTRIEAGVFKDCPKLASVDIPATVTQIEASAFEDCLSLKAADLPDGLTLIGKNAFKNCASLINVEVPDGVTSIGFCAFWGCSNLRSIAIPDSVKAIQVNMFKGCSKLTAMKIPENIGIIDK